jgi:hypothetical protein
MANRNERRRGAPVNLDALFQDGLPELAASWHEARADRVAYVALEAPGRPLNAGWVDCDGAAERLLRIADHVREFEVDTMVKAQQAAALVMRPHPDGKLRCVVSAHNGAGTRFGLFAMDPELLREINEKGRSPQAQRAREAILRDQHIASLGAQGLSDHLAAGGTVEESVVFIVDPADPRARPLAGLFAALGKRPVGDQHESGAGPTVVVGPRAMFTIDEFAELRPDIAAFLRGTAEPGKAWIVCLAHGGASLGFLTCKLAA